MSRAREAGRFDWLVELGGAGVFAAAVGFAASQLAPALLVPAGAGAFALAFLAMRLLPPEPRQHILANFAVATIEPAEALKELLLDEPYLEPADVLLLEDMLAMPDPESRVLRLFSAGPMPTAGQLKDRIDRHLATASRPIPPPVPDASQALFAALADLRRSLR